MSSPVRAAAAALLALAAAGCELVFGLDDYARAPGPDGAGGQGGGPASTTGSTTGGTAGADPVASTGSDVTSAGSTSTGGSPECQCVPAIPDGWSLVTRTDGAMNTPPPTCLNGARLAAGEPVADCSCSCSAVPATCEGARLRCWQEGGCTGTMIELDLDDACTDMLAEQRSCQAVPATPSGPTCGASGSPGPLLGGAVDVCPASTEPDATCGDGGICAVIDSDQRTCIRGEGTCPAGWVGQTLDLHVPGEAACDDCECDPLTCGAPRYKAAVGVITCEANGGTDVGTSCAGVAPAGFTSRWARRADPARLEGECLPKAPTVPATYAPGEPVRLCCLPPP